MKKLITITEPCTENRGKMQRNGNCYYCDKCSKTVTDIHLFSTEETNHFLKKNPSACVIAHERHVAGNNRFSWLNRWEDVLLKLFPRKMALVLFAAVLFLSGCFSRRHKHQVMGAWGKQDKPASASTVFKNE